VYIIEGIDRLGKDTLIKNIQNKLGFHFVLHYSKPEHLSFYGDSLQKYQEDSFTRGFALIDNVTAGFERSPLIFNRFHLGENVYAPLYRGYDGSYVFNLEDSFDVHTCKNVKLILLTTSDFSIVKDDGLGFDFSKKEEEQMLFMKAFDKSIFPNKAIIDVSDGQGGFKDTLDILEEAIA
jgi:hypothetical protein